MKTPKLSIALTIILFSNSILGQNLLIEYSTRSGSNQSTDNLIITDSVSQWNTELNTSSIEEDAFLLKQRFQNTIYMRAGVFNKLFYVKDSLNNMKWSLTSDTKVILNEKCYSAVTNFRGRIYTAYYTTSITNSDGPWKFGGLPGLILAVASDDNTYSWTAIKIIKNNIERKEKKIDILKFKFITWGDYISLFTETIDKALKQSQSDGTIQPGTTLKLKIDAPEIIYPRAQQGEGLVIEL